MTKGAYVKLSDIMSPKQAKKLGLEWNEYGRVFTTRQAPGAYPNGSRVVKVLWERNDLHLIGELATVIGSLSHPLEGLCYFVQWDTDPSDMPISVIAAKVRAVP